MRQFDYEHLDIYKIAIEFVVLIENVVKNIPKGRGYLTDQLQRASTSVPLNIAEGGGEFSQNEKCRFYRIAKRSATECAAILDICMALQIISIELYRQVRELLIRIVSMLTKMAQKSIM